MVGLSCLCILHKEGLLRNKQKFNKNTNPDTRPDVDKIILHL